MADEAKALQENNSTQTVGQKELNNREQGTSREEFGNPKEAIGTQNAEKGRSFRDSDRESFSGKFPNHKTFISIGGVGGGAEFFNTGEKKQRSLQAADGLCNFQAEVGFKTSSCPHGIPGVTSKKIGLEVEEVFDTRAARKGWTGTRLLGQQEATRMAASCRIQNQDMNHESGRADGIVCGSGSSDVLDTVSGRILSRALGVGHLLTGQMGPSPSKLSGPIVDGPNSLDHKGFEEKAEGEDYGLKQDSVLRLPEPAEDSASISSESNIEEEENKEFSKEDGEIREDQPQDDDREHLERYADKFYDHSPSSGFSVFGRPLLLGGCSGVGGTYGIQDLEIVRKEGVDDGLRGKVVAGMSIADEEVAVEDERSDEEEQNESTGNERYDNWESSCLAKFSEVLGFPTKGFEKEILELLRNLVASLKSGKAKGNTIVTKSERELRRLKSTINYNGKQTTNGGGRDKGNPQVKL